jgi:hypothetical protein
MESTASTVWGISKIGLLSVNSILTSHNRSAQYGYIHRFKQVSLEPRLLGWGLYATGALQYPPQYQAREDAYLFP